LRDDSITLGNEPLEGLWIVGKLQGRIIHDTDILYVLSNRLLQ
jgi:hypothetical protein